MKKTLIILLVCLTLAFTGCDSTPNESTTVNQTTVQETTVQETSTEEITVEETTLVETTVTTTTVNEEPVYTIDTLVLIDNEVCTVTIVEAYDSSIWGFTLKVLLENNTSDKTIMFSIDTATINGYEIDPFWAKEITAGNKANSEMSFSKSSLLRSGITSVDEVKLYLKAYDSDDWMADDFFNSTFTIYPTGLNSNEIVSPERPTGVSEYIVVDNEYCTFVIVNAYMDDIWGYTLTYYIENKTDNIELMFSWDDVAVNGFMIDPFWATSIYSNTKKVGTITFSESQLEENDITEVTLIEFVLSVYDSNDWSADDIVDETYQYSPAN